MIRTISRVEDIIDLAWELSKDNQHASYPRRKSKKDITKDIKRAIISDNESIIACYDKDVLCGMCIYYWISDEKYAQATQFLISKDYDQIADELIDYIRKQLPGYEFFIGVNLTNKNANQYFRKRNIECIESSFDTRLYNLEFYINQKHGEVEKNIKSNLEKITESNFKEYAIFHDKHAIPWGMYYNSKNLEKDIKRFRVLAFRQGEVIHGSIFVKVAAARGTADVFGLFIDKEYEDKGIESILITEMFMQLYNEFGALKEIAYFIDEDCTNELSAALNAGFENKGKYRCYKYVF